MTYFMRAIALTATTLFLFSAMASAQTPAKYTAVEGDYIAHNFKFKSGEQLADLRLHYRTLGHPQRDAAGRVTNAVLILHGTGGTGATFLSPQFAGELYGPGQPLDITRYFIILPDGIGHGKSSKPSDGLHAHFMDALEPMACLPVQIAGRNRLWREMVVDAIHNDPDWAKGDYKEEPKAALRNAEDLLVIAGSAPLVMQKAYPTRDAAEKFSDEVEKRSETLDANDLLYQVNASRNYDPSAKLESITVPVMWINSADDFINPPELGIAEKESKRLKNGTFILLPISDTTHGHGTHTWAINWKAQLQQLLDKSAH
jgi:homoserine O-acetyltransferase